MDIWKMSDTSFRSLFNVGGNSLLPTKKIQLAEMFIYFS